MTAAAQALSFRRDNLCGRYECPTTSQRDTPPGSPIVKYFNWTQAKPPEGGISVSGGGVVACGTQMRFPLVQKYQEAASRRAGRESDRRVPDKVVRPRAVGDGLPCRSRRWSRRCRTQDHCRAAAALPTRGLSHSCDLPTSMSPAPRAQAISVALASRETMRIKQATSVSRVRSQDIVIPGRRPSEHGSGRPSAPMRTRPECDSNIDNGFRGAYNRSVW